MWTPEVKHIRWIDSSIQDDQVDHHNFPKPTNAVSVGFIIEETDDYITLARDALDKDYRGLICIPKIAIIEE